MEVREPNARYLVQPAFKQTEVGLIPEDWLVKTLSELAQIQTGNTPSTSDSANYGDEFLFVSPADMGTTKYISRSEKMLSKKGFSASRLFPADSILFVCIGSTIGKAGVATKALTSNQQINAILPTTENSTSFLYYAITAAAPRIRALAGEQAVPIVNKTQFSETEITLPPTKAEQQAIAEVLSDADALIESLEQLLAKKRQIKQGAMQELLTGQKRLPGFSGAWNTLTLGEIAPLQRGFDLPTPELRPGPYPVVYSNGVLHHHKEFHVKGPGVVTGRSGTIGAVTFVQQDYWPHNTSLWVTSFKANDPKFVFYLYTTIGLERFATGSGVPTLNRNDVHSFMVSIPATKAEQTAIATVLSDLDAELAALETKLTKARQLKQGMMQELLTGRIRLV